MTRNLRRLAALLALCALVFAQLALSAHACSRPAQGPDSAAEARAHCGQCPDAQSPDDANSNLCAQHCQYGGAALDKSQPPIAAFDTAAPALRVAQPARCDATCAPAASRRSAAPAVAPPALLFGVLRI